VARGNLARFIDYIPEAQVKIVPPPKKKYRSFLIFFFKSFEKLFMKKKYPK
jgi:hypothetical protein